MNHRPKLGKFIFGGGNKLRLATDNTLAEETLSEVLVSSLYALQEHAYINAYTTGLPPKGLNNLAQHYWGIYDREGALEIINRLLKRNRNNNLRVIYEAYEYEDFPDYLKFRLHEDDEEIIKRYIAYLNKLHEVVPPLLKTGYFDEYAQVIKCQDSGWNLAQASFLARCCYDLGYIQQKELIILLRQLYKELESHCSTWQEYTASYILGRQVEGWTDIKKVKELVKQLFYNKKSPLQGKQATKI